LAGQDGTQDVLADIESMLGGVACTAALPAATLCGGIIKTLCRHPAAQGWVWGLRLF